MCDKGQPERLPGHKGQAVKVDGALDSVLRRGQKSGPAARTLTSRQELHPDDFERTGELLSWPASEAGDSHGEPDGSVGLGRTRFSAERRSEPPVVRDGVAIWPS